MVGLRLRWQMVNSTVHLGERGQIVVSWLLSARASGGSFLFGVGGEERGVVLLAER